MKNLLALEAVVTFMMTGIAREADNPMNVSQIKQYYSSTLAYSVYVSLPLVPVAMEIGSLRACCVCL